MPAKFPPHINNIIKNIEEVDRLTEIHTEIGGPGPGRRHNIEVLNKSAIVLLVACWEAYVEDLAQIAFHYMIRHTSPEHIPKKVQSLVATELKSHKDDSKIWDLAGSGWKDALNIYGSTILDRYVGRLNTPRPEQVDHLFECLVGLRSVSTKWKWRGASNMGVLTRLDDLITQRGEVAHRVFTKVSIRKKDVDAARDLIGRIAVNTSNQVANHLEKITGKAPFGLYGYGKPRGTA